MKVNGIGIWLLASLLWPGLARAEMPLLEARTTLEKWVETRQLISRSKSDWQSDRDMLEQTAQLLERELRAVEEQFTRLGTNSTQVDKERLQAEVVLKSSEEGMDAAKQFATGFEGKITKLVPQLPAPLQEILKPLLMRIPSDPANTKMASTERMQVLVGILNELDKFNNAVSVFSEKRKNAKGEELAVQTLYVGLGAAYFVSDAGDFAGTGTAGPTGWEWTTLPEIGSAVKEVVRIYRQRTPGEIRRFTRRYSMKPSLFNLIRRPVWAGVGWLLTSFACLGQDLDQLKTGAAADLQKAMADLTAVRQEIEAERLPLARRLTELEQKLSERKAEYAKAQRFQENQMVELSALKTQAKQRADEGKFIESLLSEYARAFRSRLSFIEEPRYQATFASAEKAAAEADLTPAARFASRSALLTTALQRTETALGGEVFEGKALDKQGRVQAGKVALIGPVAMFASSSGAAAGLLQQDLNKADPTVFGVDNDLDAGSRALVTTGKGQLALDATLGNAFKLTALKEPLHERLAKGGLIMIPLLGLGLAALLVAAVKWFQLSRVRVATESDLQHVLRQLEQGEKEGALLYARKILGPAGDLLATAVEHVDETKELIEEVLYEKMLGARTKLERGVPFLALAATTGPLMGLLGTVMGMIATFKLISSFGSGDPKQLAAGISEALICTATGMAVAIPSLLFHAFLSRKAKGIIGSMEQTAVGFINGVPQNRDTTFA